MAKTKICGACGNSFKCSAPRRGCWCESVAVDRATLAALREKFSDCLCPACLKHVAQAAAPGSIIPSEAI